MLHEGQKNLEKEENKFEKQGFLIVKASAGSGKTFRLVRDYLAHCLWKADPHYFRYILAITFTNKAAQEMKDRILNEVQSVAAGSGSMHQSLMEIVPISAEVLEARARALSESMMHHYEDFSVMTIDSFVNRLVRGFAKDLKWEEDFQIELDEAALIDEAVSRLLSRVGRPGEEALTRLLKGFVRQQVDEERNTNFRTQLTSFGKQVTKESMQKALDALDPEVWHPDALEAFRDAQYQLLQTRREVPVARAKAALERMEELGLEDRDFFHGDLPNWLRNVSKKKGRKASIGKRLQGQIDEATFWKSSADDDVIGRISECLPTIEEAIAAWSALYTGEEGEEFKLREHLQERVSLIGTLGLIRDELQAVQLEKNVRLLSTLNQEISAIVRDNPAPFIFERIGNRYKNIFIDEFQDTSITQWHNLIQLFEHLMSLGEKGMVVGDGKQAIYRWRNGNYEQLEALPGLIGDPGPVLLGAAEALQSSKKRAKLKFNRRSGRKIVEWNNRWFKQIQSHLPANLKSLYDDVEQTAVAEFDGHVHLQVLEESVNAERLMERNDWVLKRILHHTGGRIQEKNGVRTYVNPPDRGSHFELGDIAVLLRRNKDGAALAQYLLDFGITPWTSESLHLGRHPATRGVIALLQSVLDPQNPVHLLTFVQCYCAIHTDVSEADLLEGHHRVEKWKDKNQKDREKGVLDRKAIFTQIAPELHVWDRVTSPLTSMVGHCFEALGWGAQFPAYAEGMLELAHEVATQRNGTLKAFLSQWDRVGYRKSIRVVGGVNSVQIMTPHKAKGLDFKVVIAPFHPEKIDHFKDEIPVMLDAEVFGLPAALLRNSDMKETPLEPLRQEEIDRTVVDALNVAYVSMTRSVERLDIALEFDKPPEAGMEIKTLPQLLWTGWQAEFGNEIKGGDCSTFGTEDRKVQQKKDEATAERIHPSLVLGQAFDQKIAHPKAHWSEPLPTGTLTARQYGTAVHGLLGSVQRTSDWPALKSQIAQTANWPSDQQLKIVRVIESVIHHEAIERFFHSEPEAVFAERSLHLGEGKVGRPDRVVQLEDGWHVIDFKTGAVRDRHEAQVRGYAEAIHSMHPTARVQGWLIYTKGPELKNVPLLFG